MANPTWFDEYSYLTSKLTQLQEAGYTEYATINQVKSAIEGAGMTAYTHYQQFSLAERTSPNSYFNTDEYLAAKAAQLNTAQGVTTWTADKVALAFQNAGYTNAYDHFVAFGFSEGINPSNAFDVSDYLAAKLASLQANADTAEEWATRTVDDVQAAFEAAGIDPISHYLMAGASEGIAVTEVPAAERVGEVVDPVASFTLTVNADNLGGNADDNVYVAPVVQNDTGSGELANTFETGDVIDGGAGTDALRATLIATGTIQDAPQGAAISATTDSIEEVYLTAVTPQIDTATNTTWISTIDAGSMAGVEQWWTVESRSDIQIEDIRTRPVDTTFGVRMTDPNVSFSAYFNPLTMLGDTDSDSTLTIIIGQLTGGVIDATLELSNLSVSSLTFNLNGVTYTISNEAMASANTWAELETAITDALAAEDDLAALSVSHVGSGQFQIFDETGGTFSDQGGFSVDATTSGLIDIRNAITTETVTVEEQTETTIILDGAGSGSQGGAVRIAAASGDRGVEVFNVVVDHNSHITSLSSENNPRNIQSGYEREQQLEEVYVTHEAGGAQGTLQIGSRTVDAMGLSTTTDDRLTADGLTDVRIFDATGFDAELKIGAQLTANAFDKYLLNDAESVRLYRDGDPDNPVQFSYTLGDAGSNLNLAVNNVLAGDVDFALDIIGGDGDDRVNLTGLAVKQNTTIDGEEGNNTLEVNTSTGFAATQNGFDIVAPAATDLTAAETSFESVVNIDRVVVAGTGNTTHDLVAGGFGSIGEFIIATDGNDSTRMINLDTTTQSVVVSGKNQTLGAGNSDNNQTFNVIRLTDTNGAEMDLLLDNTARVLGTLTVTALTFDAQVGNANDVRTLNLESGGVRDTANVITTLNGNLVNTFNLVGTQDLRITNLASAANSTAAAASVDSLLVDGSELAGDLYLGVTGAVITAVDAAQGTNRTVELIGTDGESDILNIRGGVTTTNATTISEFETIRFGEGILIGTATNFNATNVSDVDLYDLFDSVPGGPIALTNLRSTENVQINASDFVNGTDWRSDVLLAAANATAGSQVNVNFVTDDTTADFLVQSTWDNAGVRTLSVRDFSTISLDMGGTAGQNYDYNFNLDLQPSIVAPLTVKARTLEITGGQFDANFTNVDSITLNELDTALTLVDFSEYNGNFICQGWDSTQGSNAEIVVNEFGLRFDVGGDNTVITVTDTGGAADVFELNTIDFVAGAAFTGVPGGGLLAGEDITITFAGGKYVFTNDTGAEILDVDIKAAILADFAVNGTDAFDLTSGAGNLINITANVIGDVPNAFIESLGVNITAGSTVVEATPGDIFTAVPGTVDYDLVRQASEFLTKFTFTEDAYAEGVVWQIDNFQPFDNLENMTLNNQTQLDLRQLGVDSSTKITISAGDAFLTAVNADPAAIAAYTAFGNYVAVGGDGIVQIQELTANDTVVTSNDGLDFTIILQGVLATNLGNENIVGIA